MTSTWHDDDIHPPPDAGFPPRPRHGADQPDTIPVFHGPVTIHRGADAGLRLPPSPPLTSATPPQPHRSERTDVVYIPPFGSAVFPSVEPTPAGGGRDRRVRRLVLPLLLTVALAAVGGWGFTEHRSAGEWKARHGRAADVVRETKLALTGAEADLLATEGTLAEERDLSAQLGDEKADLADQRTQLADLLATAPAVTEALLTCSSSMSDAVVAALEVAKDMIGDSYVSFASLNSAIDQANRDCDTAQLLAGDLDAGISDLGL